jgi:exopolyphosphatase/guanosine-5'-triphosphate,3'-diphosphate pyrophosphatase
MSPLVEESHSIRARYDEEPSHSDQVANLALQIFDGLKGPFNLTARHRELLNSAALLHDIGWSQTPDGKGHHKWSAKLIQEQPWKNLKREEIRLVAQIARYHRKTVPKTDHEDFQALPSNAQKLVMILGGILRIADGLDRTHASRIEGIGVAVSDQTIVVRVTPTGSWDAEREMFETKRDMLELATKRSVRCELQKAG